MERSATTPATPLVNTYWVLPGRLLAGEHPCGAVPELTRTRLARLLAVGIDCFIDLTHTREQMSTYHDALPVGVTYLSRPIPDHGVPAQRAHMAAILASLREALASGRRVYLHCRAGIGRTATVAGCFLAEQSGGEEALAQLNLLWLQSARSAQWPTVPETLEQIDYVRQWTPLAACAPAADSDRETDPSGEPEPDPLLAPATLAAARGLRKRFHGALLGLAVGDAVAAPTQYGRPGRFTPVGDMLGGGPFELPRGGWSDDTAMTLCLAESLLECEGFDARDQVERYRRWQQHGYLSATGQCVGITAATARALALAQWRRQPFAGAHDPEAQDPESLSRVAAVALYFFARGEVVTGEQAAQAARTTCQAPGVLAGCRTLAAALHAALCGRKKPAVLEKLEPATGTAGALPALAAASDVFARTRNFREAALAAANLGGNSDVIAAVCGALAGAYYGVGSIPAAWREGLLQQELIEGFADRLLAHALLDLGR